MEKIVTSYLNKEELPLVVQPKGQKMSLGDWVIYLRENRAFFQKALLKNGGILFRGFPIQSPDDFGALIEAMGTGPCVDYVGGDSPRNKVKGNIYTSTEAPPSFKIPLHNELSFVKYFPSHIYFYCETPSQEGGETIIADARKIYQTVDADVRGRFEEKGLKYVSRYYSKSPLMDLINKIQRGHKTWKEVLETDKKEEVEKKCRDNEFGFCWHKNDWLEITQKAPASLKHPHTQETVWFNQSHLYDYNPRLLGWHRYLGTKVILGEVDTITPELLTTTSEALYRKYLNLI